MKQKCILWDFDNTLAFRDGKWTRTLADILNKNGYFNFSENDISPFFKRELPWNRHEEAHDQYFEGRTWWEVANAVISRAVSAAGINDPDENSKLTLQFRDEYLKLEAWHLFDDTIVNLKRSVESGFANILVSNHTPELSMLAGKLGIENFFNLILSSALTGYDKPHREMFRQIYRIGAYEKYCMVGDNYNADVLGGLRMGFTSILVRNENLMKYEYSSKDLHGIWEFIG